MSNDINNQFTNPPSANGALVADHQGAVAPRQPSYGQLGDYMGGGEGGGGGGDELTIDLRDYWRTIVKRKWMILSFVASSLVFGAAYTLMQQPLYTSTVRLQVDRDTIEVVEQGNIMKRAGGAGRKFLITQYKLIESKMMAERVVALLGLSENEDFLNSRGGSLRGSLSKAVRGILGATGEAGNTPPDKKLIASQLVLERRTVNPVRGSILVDINYTDPQPRRAQKITGAYAEAFIAANVDKRFQANASARIFLEDKIAQLKLRLRSSETALLVFAKKEQIIATTEKTSIAENNLAAANAALGELTRDRIKKEQLWKQAQSGKAVNLSQLRTSQNLGTLQEKRDTLTTEYREKLETFKPEYPGMIEIRNKIAQIDRHIKAELTRGRETLKADYEAALTQESEMEARIDELKVAALDLKQRSIQYNSLKREVDTNRELYNSLLRRFKEVDVAAGAGTNNIFVIDRANMPTSPSSPKLLKSLLLFFALGLGGGFVSAFLLEHLDDTVHTVEELHALSHLTTLGIIPRVQANSTVEDEFADPRSPLSEAYRSLATSLQLATESGLPKVLSVTSAGPSEAKSTTAIALAKHFAAMDMRVLLIDADLRKPSLHEKMFVQNTVGLSNYLTGSCEPQAAMQATQTPNLAVMCSGPLPPNAADLLGGNKLFSLLSSGLTVFDFIIIDGPPVLGLADAQLLSNAASATIFVAASGQVRIGQIKGALNRLRMVNRPIIGAVLTKFDAKAAGYGGYGGYSGYGGYGAYGTDEHYSYGAPIKAVEKEPQD